MRLKSSSACAYSMPKTASASVLPYTCAMPQSSRMMVTRCACLSQRSTSLLRRWACSGKARRALLASSSIDRNGGSRSKSQVNRARGVDRYRTTGNQIQIRTCRHPRGNGGIEAGRLVVDGNEAFIAARERDRVGAVVPPVVDIGARDDMPEAHHVQNRGIAVLADPLV